MRTFMSSALWARVLLAMLVAMEFMVDLVRAATLEDRSEYQACLVSPSTCTYLDLDRNSLSGTIPTEIAEMTSLTRLRLQFNSLSGTIPTVLGEMTRLTALALGANSLTSTIPTELGELTSLTELALAANSFTSTIPTELGELTSLGYLGLADNSLTSSIPTELGELTRLTTLYPNNNAGLCGPLVSMGFVGTSYLRGGTNLGNACPGSLLPSPSPTSTPTESLIVAVFVPPPSPPPPPSLLVTTMSETPTCEDTCGLVDVDMAQWTDDQAKCVRKCIKKQNSATTNAGAVGLVVGALAAAMYAFF